MKLAPVLTLMVIFGLGGIALAAETCINSFESQADIAKVVPSNVTISLVMGKGVTDGTHAAKVVFHPGPWPNITFHVGQGFPSGDWRQYGAVAFDVTNLERAEPYLATRVDDDPAADGAHHSRTGWLYQSLPSGRTVTVEVTFERMAEMRRGPTVVPGALPTTQDGPVGEPLDWSHITTFEIWLPGPTKDHTLIIDNVRLLPRPDLKGIVDRYGQYSRDDWPGKVHSDADLQRELAEEEQWIAGQKRPADLDEYGGWAAGPELRATGFFRTAYVVGNAEVAGGPRQGGRWWLVTPSGHLFFSQGIDGVAFPSETTHITGRDELFSWLPGKGDPLEEFCLVRADRWADFNAMNLRRKYGPDWQRRYADISSRRMLAWGFNTLGNWSLPEACRQRRVPYTVPVVLGWLDQHRVLRYFPTAHSGDQVDVFDEAFPGRLNELLANPPLDAMPTWVEKHVIRDSRDDPWCIGYFFENEVAWARWGSGPNEADLDVAISALASDDTLAAKRAFVDRLRGRYADIARLNEAWHTACASWEKLLVEPVKVPAAMTDACKADLKGFLALFARRHFEVAAAALKKADPNHLNLGCRFANLPPDMEIVRAAADTCDVVSFNVYEPALLTDKWAFTSTLGKPCLIGEFHFGALDRGMFNVGCNSAHDQGERGRLYAQYVRSAWALPAFVGCHWFQYHDEPLTGRWDGENYNIGFVSNADYPYWELVNAARTINAQIYAVRGKAADRQSGQ